MRKKQRVNLLSGSVASAVLLLAVAAGFMVLSFLISRGIGGIRVWGVCMAAAILLLFLDVLLFRRFVWLPMARLREALGRLDAVDGGGSIDLSVSADSMARRINELLQEVQQSIEREHGEEVLRQQSRFSELQNQINPHFLYNTLETIRGQAVIDDNYMIADMTEALAKYFRYNISRDNDTVTIEQELENILCYVRIQQYRFQDRFVFRIYPHAKEEEYADCLIPKMTLQPVVENAIVHGIEQKVEKGHISIYIEMTQQRISIIVADDGAGMDEETLEELNQSLRREDRPHNLSPKGRHNGIAMGNVNSRLRLLYGDDYGLRIASTRGLGTEVEITLPVIRAEKHRG